jgi:hypothetical protein
MEANVAFPVPIPFLVKIFPWRPFRPLPLLGQTAVFKAFVPLGKKRNLATAASQGCSIDIPSILLMNHVNLGRSGFHVACLCSGTMSVAPKTSQKDGFPITNASRA